MIPISVAQINGAALERDRKLLVLIGFSLCGPVVPVRHPASWVGRPALVLVWKLNEREFRFKSGF